MAIVKMKKFKLFALEKDRKALLKELQKFDYVHFIKTSNEENEYLKEVELPENINLLKEKSKCSVELFEISSLTSLGKSFNKKLFIHLTF